MKKKWIKIWLSISIIILFVGIFNYKIDSLGLVNQNGYLDKAAIDLSNGKIIAGLRNFDERIFRKKIIENLNEPPEWIAVGSSRIMQLRQDMILSKDIIFQNYSVSGASLEDYMALIQIHRNRFNEYPKNIIIGVDPWIFNKYHGQMRYKSIQESYDDFLKTLGEKDLKRTKNYSNFLKIFSYEYLIENIKFLLNNFSNGMKGYYIVDSLDVDDSLRLTDGSLYYSLDKRNPNFEEVKQKALEYGNGQVYSLEKFDKISNQKIFERFINHLKKHDVNIIFYLPSYNPYAYDLIIKNQKYKHIQTVEEYLKVFAKRSDIKVIGSYNPHIIDAKSNDFFDGMHALDQLYYKLFKEIKEGGSN